MYEGIFTTKLFENMKPSLTLGYYITEPCDTLIKHVIPQSILNPINGLLFIIEFNLCLAKVRKFRPFWRVEA